MKLNQQRLALSLLSIRYCDVLATGDNALGDLKRILRFDLNEPPPLEIEHTNSVNNLKKDLIHETREGGVGKNSDPRNIATQNSSPVSQPAIQTSEFEVADQSSNEPRCDVGKQQNDGLNLLDSQQDPAREAKTCLLTDLYQSGQVWGKSSPRSKYMRVPSKRLSSKSPNVLKEVAHKTSDPATSSRKPKTEEEMYFLQDSLELRKSTSNSNPRRESKMKLTRISPMRSKG